MNEELHALKGLFGADNVLPFVRPAGIEYLFTHDFLGDAEKSAFIEKFCEVLGIKRERIIEETGDPQYAFSVPASAIKDSPLIINYLQAINSGAQFDRPTAPPEVADPVAIDLDDVPPPGEEPTDIYPANSKEIVIPEAANPQNSTLEQIKAVFKLADVETRVIDRHSTYVIPLSAFPAVTIDGEPRAIHSSQITMELKKQLGDLNVSRIMDQDGNKVVAIGIRAVDNIGMGNVILDSIMENITTSMSKALFHERTRQQPDTPHSL